MDMVVSTVRHPGLAAERIVLCEGGTLLHLDDLPAAERCRLKGEMAAPRGLVVDRSGVVGVAALALVELLEQHPEADTVEYGFLLSAAEAGGRAGGAFVHRLLGGRARHPTARFELPNPFGRRRCIEAGPAVERLLREAVGAQTAHLYVCFLPAALNAAMLALNSLGLASRLPLAVFTGRRRSVPAEPSRQPTCHWVSIRQAGDLVASRFVLGEGDYRMTVAATAVFAEALIAQAGSRKGVFGAEEVLTLAPLAPALAARGIRIAAGSGVGVRPTPPVSGYAR
ncbi:MAG: hypothetical protein E6J72_16535 [Deltaproteobacteria bacterium]|nr:MAG: hypothetical protein E6J72_16535 [Deltaproteobacteria bacterium]